MEEERQDRQKRAIAEKEGGRHRRGRGEDEERESRGKDSGERQI